MHADRSRRRSGFTVIDLMVVGAVLVILVVLVMIVWPAGGRTGGHGRQMPNNTQLRGIHQGMVIYAQSNKKGGNDGYFPGLDASGNVIPDGPLTGHSGDGTVPGVALWMMLEGNYFTPEYIINPADSYAIELDYVPGTASHSPITHDNFSYAFQSLVGHPAERAEWKETLNTAAVVLGDRAIGTGPADISSVWTDPGSGDWRGGVVKNDNSTGFETNPVMNNTRYGGELPNPTDHLFDDDPGTADAFLVHEDATTAYSAR